MPSRQYNIDSFIEALVTAERYRNAAPELRDWHQARASSISEALGVNENDHNPDQLSIGVDTMLRHAITVAACQGHPFEGFMECPKELYELVSPYTAIIAGLTDDLRKQWVALARALLLRVHPHLATASTTSEELQTLGFDDSAEPDAIDFF